MPIKSLLLGLCLLLAMTYLPTNAQSQGKTGWHELTPEVQTLLGEYQAEWASMAVGQQQQLLSTGQHWLALPEGRRSALWQRFQQWQAMSAGQRVDMQEHYQRWRQLPDADRQRLMQGHNRFQQMPASKQQEMLQRFNEFQQRGGYGMGSSMQGQMRGIPSGAAPFGGSMPNTPNMSGGMNPH